MSLLYFYFSFQSKKRKINSEGDHKRTGEIYSHKKSTTKSRNPNESGHGSSISTTTYRSKTAVPTVSSQVIRAKQLKSGLLEKAKQTSNKKHSKAIKSKGKKLLKLSTIVSPTDKTHSLIGDQEGSSNRFNSNQTAFLSSTIVHTDSSMSVPDCLTSGDPALEFSDSVHSSQDSFSCSTSQWDLTTTSGSKTPLCREELAWCR